MRTLKPLCLFALGLVSCDAPSDADRDGFEALRDCDDANPWVFPGAEELCDGLDNDCDGQVDGIGASDGRTWYADADGDTFGDLGVPVVSCTAPEGYVADSTDCDDSDPETNPRAWEDPCSPVDRDCDQVVGWVDADGDGWAACGGDCDDDDDAIHPGAPELCGGVDEDCDGFVDEEPQDIATYYLDYDGDGFGNAAYPVTVCTAPDGYSATAGDCDDFEASAHPGSTEVCDGLDNDCNGVVDLDAASGVQWYPDEDGDGFGATSGLVIGCVPPAGHVAVGGDCDDADGARNPAAEEVCNGVDDDCSGNADVGAVDADTWYRDADGDGYGVSSEVMLSCSHPAGFTAVVGDCAPANVSVHPGATEVCDGVDNDCDGGIDLMAADAPTWYLDYDGDGFGAAVYALVTCSGPPGYVANAEDCLDIDETVNPFGAEVCNDGVDNDCDGTPNQCLVPPDLSSEWTFQFDGWGCGASAGHSVASPGDVNGDGFADLLVGAPEILPEEGSCPSGGGGGGGINVTRSYWPPGGGYTPRTGSVALLLGPLAGDSVAYEQRILLKGSQDREYVGYSVASIGDLDGDGLGDFLVGAPGSPYSPYETSNVYLVLGSTDAWTNGLVSDYASLTLSSEYPRTYAGASVAIVDDMTGDGVRDFAIGAPGHSEGGFANAGGVYIVSGTLRGTYSIEAATVFLPGTEEEEWAGMEVASLGDVDGDGYGDLAIAGPFGATGGHAWIVRGGPRMSEDLSDHFRIDGLSSGSDERLTVAGGGDVTGDGIPDLLVGGWTPPETGEVPAVFVVSGRLVRDRLAAGTSSAVLDLTQKVEGTDVIVLDADDGFSSLLVPAVAGDIDSDGWLDVVVGSESDFSQGLAYLVLGPITASSTLQDASASMITELGDEEVGFATGVGDTNGDGHDDFVLGIWQYTDYEAYHALNLGRVAVFDGRGI